MKIRRIDPHRLEVMTGTDRHLLTPAAPVAHFTDGKARVRVTNDSGTMEVQLIGKGTIEVNSLGLGSTYRIDEHGLID